ncbi:PREDICTED: G patch domain-containing protein 3 [Dipodomys ordii]|uniref:G patch domain-containing protein 3 n=1 Tax=Dipodomys ordii TaxID=10020 RepID=A0A1S3GHM6_DIPOR|nr:PREDICTED: G patch domain-containing protein 3 [Dipodomys ordii]
MATPSEVEEEATVYLVVTGIPSALRSAQLRSYFSQFREQRGGGFLCFHYRHRPEGAPAQASDAGLPSSDPAAESQDLAQTTAAASRALSARNSARGQTRTCQTRTCCCVISVRGLALARKLVRMYSGRRWLDSQGTWLPGRCHIHRLRLPTEASGLGSFPFKTRKELQSRKAENEAFSLTDLRQLPELNPPVLMPNGNVGTPLRVFLELIRACRLPPRIITQLQLQFPKTGSSRRYGNVPFKYEESETVEQEEHVYTAEGEEIPQGTCLIDAPASISEETADEGEREEKEESHSDDDDDRGEEWERHEALHDDVTRQERTTERLFEEEIELKWEKGGSGLVFYTDAQFWQEEEGDFDEQTADDWDVDMSIYYDRGTGLGYFLSLKALFKSRYHGEKLQPFGQLKRSRGTGLGLISTIYDEPLPQDQKESLLRRQPPTSLKFRTDMAFVRGSRCASDSPWEPE